MVGGAAVTEEIVPGFRFSRASYVLSLLRPQIVTDLELKVVRADDVLVGSVGHVGNAEFTSYVVVNSPGLCEIANDTAHH